MTGRVVQVRFLRGSLVRMRLKRKRRRHRNKIQRIAALVRLLWEMAWEGVGP